MDGIVRSGKVEDAPNWRLDAQGKYISFREQVSHTVFFKSGNPVKENISINGKDKISYQWPVLEDGYDRILSVTSSRLLRLLAAEETLDGLKVTITYNPIERTYVLTKV